ncbi:hypothetical protein [Novosphingobium rosa]|uniref:hypothetical protein n=1 Tax=Novosphingobium rosa TaxID=76978 RepID=UPI00083444E0|nr:hypothetical protein [Novosphingobium rosa]
MVGAEGPGLPIILRPMRMDAMDVLSTLSTVSAQVALLDFTPPAFCRFAASPLQAAPSGAPLNEARGANETQDKKVAPHGAHRPFPALRKLRAH